MKALFFVLLLLAAGCALEDPDSTEKVTEAGKKGIGIVVEDFQPSSGSSFSGREPVTVTLSSVVSEEAFIREFSVNPAVDYTLEQQDGNRVVITPSEDWRERTVYRFTLSDESFFLYVAGNVVPPEIVFSAVAYNDGEEFPVISENLDSMQKDDVLLLRFSAPPVKESAAESLVIEPSDNYLKLWPDDRTMVIIPEKGWKCGAGYRLEHESVCLDFTPDVPYLELKEIRGPTSDGFPVTVFERSRPVNINSDGTYTLGFVFSRDFRSRKEKESAYSGLSLSPFFPAGVNTPSVSSVRWFNDNILQLDFRGLVPGTWYDLRLRGGENGIVNAEGCFPEEDISLVLITG